MVRRPVLFPASIQNMLDRHELGAYAEIDDTGTRLVLVGPRENQERLLMELLTSMVRLAPTRGALTLVKG